MAENILRGHNLTCIRGDRPIFSNLDFELNPGRALVLRGANGSGKSSLMKMISGLLKIEQGSLSYNGEDVQNDKDWISQNLCYLAHKNGMKPEMTIEENLQFWNRMENSAAGSNRSDITQAAKKIGIDHCLDLPVSYLSSGQGRRAALTRVLCHPARTWLLDEPTVGLDHAGVELLANLMNEHLDNGGSILAATHIELGLNMEKTDILNMSEFSFKATFTLDEEESLLC